MISKPMKRDLISNRDKGFIILLSVLFAGMPTCMKYRMDDSSLFCFIKRINHYVGKDKD